PASITPVHSRSRRLVVFGTRGRRAEVYKRAANQLNHICRALGLETIADVGRRVGLDIGSVLELPGVECGELSKQHLSDLLLDSVAGAIDYPEMLLGKSSIFAAYCAHGVMPIVTGSYRMPPRDGLSAGSEYWLAEKDTNSLNLETADAISSRAAHWYKGHALSAHANRLSELLSSNVTVHGAWRCA